jgi:RND family efflux transporter MFP subunit
LALLTLAACNGKPDAPQEVAPRAALTITVAKPQQRTLAQEIAANGNIAAWQEASVGADVQGLRIAQVNVNVGDAVQKGQVLATFDAEPVRQDQAQAEAALAEAEAALADAAANAARARAVAGSGALSEQQIAQYQTGEQTARARVQAARAQLAAQRLRVSHTEVRAPRAGIISACSATVGQVAGAGVELFRLVLDGRLEWRAELMAEDLPRIRTGESVSIELPGPPGAAPVVQGTVRQIAPTVDPRTRYAIVYVDLPADSPARAGMFASGRFAVGESAALTVPQEAIVMRDGYPHVMLLEPGDAVRMARVRTGRLAGDAIEVLEGLPETAQVAVRGAAFLSDGDRVRVVEDAP